VISRWIRHRDSNKFCANLEKKKKKSAPDTPEIIRQAFWEESMRGTRRRLWRLRESVRRLRPEIWRKKNWLWHDNALSNTSFFTREFFTKSNMTVVPHSPYFSLFSQLKIKQKGRLFYTIEVMKAESQAVLNIFPEHVFQGAFKNGRSTGNGAYAWKATTPRLMVACRPKS
jgi:hypothetical protein